ncbi:MAG: DUF309 domain-containing protein [bacterium]
MEDRARITGSVDERFAFAIALFNDERYFEFHDVLEDLWREEPGPERDFYQGLLQVGVALHKARLAQMSGAWKLLEKGRARLAPFGAAHRGVPIADVLAAIESWLARSSERARAGLPAWPEGTPPRIAGTASVT